MATEDKPITAKKWEQLTTYRPRFEFFSPRSRITLDMIQRPLLYEEVLDDMVQDKDYGITKSLCQIFSYNQFMSEDTSHA